MNSHQTSICWNLAASEIRHETLNGKRYMVVPCAMLTEGVFSGSSGPLLYRSETLQKHAAAWNGRSICLSHPTNGNAPVSIADSPDVFESSSIGFLFDSRFEGGKLRANLWIDVEKAQTVAPEVLEWIRSGRKLEVSTGFFSDDQDTPGSWNGTPYNRIVESIYPDHLAIISPDDKAACGWEAGCGIRSNQLTCNKNRKKENHDMEEPLVTAGFFWDCPIDVQHRVKRHFAANSSLEAAELRCHQMTDLEALALDRELQGKSGCGGCGGHGTPAKVNGEEEETPLEVPVMEW